MFTAESFCNAVWGFSYSKMPAYSKDEYKTFEIPKKNGTRTISYLEKDSVLFSLQQKLMRNYLYTLPLPTCVKGFVKGESYREFLSAHIGNCFFLRVDISSFFPSITRTIISEELGNYLHLGEDSETLISLISDMVTINEVLPQGASTSPAISNLVMARLDQRILKYCQVFDVNYSRYADDLLFSSKSFDFNEKTWFLSKIKNILKTHNFSLNYSKMKYGKGEISLNGYVISKSEIRLSRKRLSDLRTIIVFINNNQGMLRTARVEEFLLKINNEKLKHRDLTQHPFRSLFQLSQYLCGMRAYLISWVYPDLKTQFQKELSRLIRKTERAIELLL